MKIFRSLTALLILTIVVVQPLLAQTDATTPLHLLKPDYPTPYGVPKPEEVSAVLERVRAYLDGVTPIGFVNDQTGAAVDPANIDDHTILARGDFRIVSYEWGVTYAGMIHAAASTGDKRFSDYVEKRLGFIADASAKIRKTPGKYSEWEAKMPLRNLVNPRALDDCGAMCAAMIKAKRAGVKADLQPIIDTAIKHISTGQQRLADGTLARSRPLPNTLWLDDLFMSVPALAQMGKLTGETKYFDDAVRQVQQFEKRMFNPQLGVFMHGWVQDMGEHPEFHWARANGWAFMAQVELLDVLPENHPAHPALVALLRKHAKGLASYQHGTGFWHQLLDRSDSYLETSATAIYAYSYAKAINRGWLDAKAYGPAAILAWNAVATKVNPKGQVEGTCVGTGMGFDPAFYFYRPVSPYAAHGYGPVLLAGSEMLDLIKSKNFNINDSAVMNVEK